MSKTPAPSLDNHGRRNLVAAAGLFGLLLYAMTCAPGVLWQDSATFQFRVRRFELYSELGLALAHPLYVLLARAFALLSWGDFAHRVNLFSVVCAAAALALTADLLWKLTRCRLAAVLGVLMLGLSHTFWRHAVIAEVYSLYALGLVAELCLLERFCRTRRGRWLLFALIVNGLNVSNHLLALLHGPVYLGLVVVAIRRGDLRPRRVPALLGAFLLGASPYLGLIAAEIAGGRPVLDTLHSALFGDAFAGHVMNASVSLPRQAARAGEFFGLNFPTPLILLAPLGLRRGWKEAGTRWFVAVGGALFAIAFIFAFRYPVPDQYVFFFPCYVLLACFVALAVRSCASATRAKRARLVARAIQPAGGYEVAPSILKQWRVSFGADTRVPYRDNYTYFLRPRQNGYVGAARFAREALQRATPDGLLVADSTIMNVLVYVRDVEGLGRGVTLTRTADVAPAEPAIEPTLEAVLPFVRRGAAFACREASGPLPPWMTKRLRFIPDGVLFRLEE
ncbi:MAG: protein O-mannosyl-transferase family [Phycisphaerae bacterium]